MTGINGGRKISKMAIAGMATILLILAVSPAQAIRIKKKGRPVQVEKYVSPWSFQIALDEQIGDDGEGYSGVMFSVNHFFNPTGALRFSMGIGNDNPTYDEARIFRNNDEVYIFEEYDELDVTGVTFSLQGMFYTAPERVPRFYWGLGPRLGIRDANPTVLISYDDYEPYSADEVVLYDDATMVSLGIEGSMGFEFFLGRNLSMMMEYGIAAQKEWYILEFDYYDHWGYRVTETETFDDGFHLDASRIRLGMSFYF